MILQSSNPMKRPKLKIYWSTNKYCLISYFSVDLRCFPKTQIKKPENVERQTNIIGFYMFCWQEIYRINHLKCIVVMIFYKWIYCHSVTVKKNFFLNKKLENTLMRWNDNKVTFLIKSLLLFLQKHVLVEHF